MILKTEDKVMPEISIEIIDRPVHYLAYFLSIIYKGVGSDVAQTISHVSLSPAIANSCLSAFCLFETDFHVGPVYYVPPFVDVGASIVFVLQIVGMFPHVKNQ
jgi:hypothetical protein